MFEIKVFAFVILFVAFDFSFCKIQSRLNGNVPLFQEKPPWLKVCKRSDPNLDRCLNEMFTLMFPELAKGMPEVNIAPFEPLYIDKVSVSKGAGPIILSGSLINLTVVGPSNASSTFTELDISKRKMRSGIYLPLLDIKAQYNLKGKILVLPLVGQGTCDLKLFKVDTKIATDLSFPKIDGREILRINHMNVNFSVDGMKINLRNLFNGNQVLGQTLNSFLNQNAQEVINELSDSIGLSLGDILKDLMNEIFSKIPTDLWLLEEGIEENRKEEQQIHKNSVQSEATKNFNSTN